MITQRILDFLNTYKGYGPVLVVDLSIVDTNYSQFEAAMPDTKIYYAIKANPDHKILSLLHKRGSNFDCASVAEIQLALNAGAHADQISFGNTIKKKRDILKAYELGVRLFAVDAIEEVEKIAEVAPGSQVFCRILTDGDGAEWPLSRKFGCVPDMAVDILKKAHDLGLKPVGVSFHVGSQMTKIDAWDIAINESKMIFDQMEQMGIKLTLLNLGGGFPTKYLKDIPSTKSFGESINESLRRYFGNNIPQTIIEPGRGMVGNAGVIRTEVVLISKKSPADSHRWVFLDIGKFGGLSETADEAIRYPIFSSRDNDAKADCVLAGPTCDSADVLYERKMYPLPTTLEVGDFLLIDCVGVYTTTYSAVAFNGFEPLKSFVLE
jgi:ornithine decarboxylase